MNSVLVIARRHGISPELRRLRRLVLILGHILKGFCLAVRHDAFRDPHRPVVRRVAQRWQQELLSILGVNVTVSGEPASGTVLHVSNHVSWLDIPVIGSLVPVHFLSKDEVRRWPLIGLLARAAGTLFIRRGSGESGSKAAEIAGHLGQQRTILVFPEGTTTDGTRVRRFFPALFRAPVLAGTAVQPLALRYHDGVAGIDVSAAFVGDDSFHVHLWQLLLRDQIHAHVHFCDPGTAVHMDHRTLAERAHRDIVTALGIPAIPRS